MTEPQPLTVHIVDDDAAVRDSLSLLLSLRGHRTATFDSAESLLAAVTPHSQGCVIADLRMPGMDGLALQRELRARGIDMPVVIVTGHGDVASAREAFRNAAVDFLEKPFDENGPPDAVAAAFERERARLARTEAHGAREARLASLTPRERDVLAEVVTGLHNKDVARRLAISPRTVEVHKARIMAKLGARNLADLIRIAQQP